MRRRSLAESDHSDDLGYSDHSGVALVVILVFLVLLSGLVMAFFSRATADRQLSQRYADTVDTKLLAQGAVNMIIGDLKQEISAGSTNVPVGSSTLTYPATAQSAVPSRVGTTNTLPNLVKTSISGSDFYSSTNASAFPQGAGFPPSRRASAVSTTVVSRNGRSVPKTRWNAPLLLPANRVNTEFRAPDWIYVTVNGTNPTGFSPSLTKGSNNEVLGRFAYCLYDEGGLLDVNVAGYPTKLDQHPTNAPGFEATRKGSPGLASLRAVLSAAGFTDPAAQRATDALVSWRNAATTNSGTWPGNYLDYLRTPGRSFLKVNSTNGMADSAFVSRQELIQFVSTHSDWTNAVPSSATRTDALRFLGTFSRDLQQPSYKPPTLGSADRPTIRAGASRGRLDVFAGGNTAATLEDRINPAFLEVRVQRAFTRASDGKQAVEGEPLVKYRFPLSQLKWLTCEGPAAASVVNDPSYTDLNKAQRVLDVFGLTWDAANKWWTYNHGKGNGTGNGIYTLAEVADLPAGEAREPDFIELLQAAINVGSLGKSVCPEPIYVPNKLNMSSARLAENLYSAGTKDELVPAMPEFQILKIATSIIDQADPDSFPTEIRMRSPITQNGVANIIATYGTERLPMISRISFHFASRDVDPANPADQGGFGVYVVPELWNPHEETTHEGKIAPNNVPPGPVPTQFRLTLVSTNKNAAYQIRNGDNTSSTLTGFNPNNTTAGTVPNTWSYTYTDPVGPWSGKAGISGTGRTSYTFSSSYPGYPFTTPTPIYENAQIPPLTKSGSTWEIAAFPLIVFDPWLPRFKVGPNGTTNAPLPATSTEALADAAKRITKSNQAGTLTNLALLGDIPQLYINTSFGNILVQLECQDAGGIWRVIDSTEELMQAVSIGLDYNSMPTIDPRSDQFPPVRTYYPGNGSWFDRVSFGETFRPNYVQQGNKAWRWLFNNATTATPGWQAPLNSKIPPNGEMTYFLGLISQNTRTPKLATFKGSSVDVNTFYADPDGVVRGGDAMFATSAGQDMLTTALPNQARPIILNRPFRSVGELGYAFRGQPFKTLDFFSDRTNRTDGSAPNSGTDSADTALLDLFCIDQPSYETGGLVAGTISLNTRNAPVIEALLKAGSSGGVLDESPGAANSFLSSADQTNIASRFVAATTTNPLSNPSEIISRIIQGAAIPSLQNAADANFKRRREASVRLLSAGTTARVWNLMIDVIAQVGIFPPGSTNLGSDFVVQGERRVWVHLAIDRLTGEVLDSQLERVTE